MLLAFARIHLRQYSASHLSPHPRRIWWVPLSNAIQLHQLEKQKIADEHHFRLELQS